MSTSVSDIPLMMNINGSVKGPIIPIARSVTVANGNAVFYLTDDNTATGNALYTHVWLEGCMFRGVEVDSAFTMGQPVVSSDMKTLTVPVKKSVATAIALLGLSLLGAPAPANGSTVSAFIIGDNNP